MNQITPVVHPAWLRILHWFNAIAVVLMVMSGWRIYNANAFLGFDIPSKITLGDWLGGAIQWHFAAMWLLVMNGSLYLALNIGLGRLFRKFFPISLTSFFVELLTALKGKLTHIDPHNYNTVQRVAYLFVILDSLVLVMSGLVLWKSVQFPLLRELLGDYEVARRIHFFAMSALVSFVLVHLVMVALVPKTFRYIVLGR